MSDQLQRALAVLADHVGYCWIEVELCGYRCSVGRNYKQRSWSVYVYTETGELLFVTCPRDQDVHDPSAYGNALEMSVTRSAIAVADEQMRRG